MIYRHITLVTVLRATLLLPFTIIFYIILRIRHFLYDSGVLSSYLSGTYTVSVGNITAGGTGKTPHIIEIASALEKEGKRTVVITRGYKRSSSGRIEVGDNTDALTAGDEPLTIFKKTGARVICDTDRKSAVKDAEGSSDIILLDDAFQHRKIKKHLDIVLIDFGRFLGSGLLLPSGILRDIPSRLYKCDAIILTKIHGPLNNPPEKEIEYLKNFGKPLYLSLIRYTSVSNGSKKINREELKNKKISAFCGIADPEPFFGFFDDLKLIRKKSFTDHAAYGRKFDSELSALNKGTDIIITTFKDFVKLFDDQKAKYNIFYLDMDIDIFDSSLKPVPVTDILKGFK